MMMVNNLNVRQCHHVTRHVKGEHGKRHTIANYNNADTKSTPKKYGWYSNKTQREMHQKNGATKKATTGEAGHFVELISFGGSMDAKDSCWNDNFSVFLVNSRNDFYEISQISCLIIYMLTK